MNLKFKINNFKKGFPSREGLGVCFNNIKDLI